MNYTNSAKINFNTNFYVTLMIPSSMEKFLNNKLANYSRKNLYLKTLLGKYNQKSLLTMPRHSLPTTKYQNANLDLLRYNFKTNGADWYKLKILAFHMGISMSLLFVLMMALDKEGCCEDKVPTFSLILNISTAKYNGNSSLTINFIQTLYDLIINSSI